MNFANKLKAQDAMIFARENLINKYKVVDTCCMETNKSDDGWVVTHQFLNEADKLTQEGYLFTDFNVLYVAGECKEIVPDFDFMSGVQEEYRSFMSKKFGEQYEERLEAMLAEAEKIMARFEEIDKDTAEKQDEEELTSTQNAEETSTTEEFSQVR